MLGGPARVGSECLSGHVNWNWVSTGSLVGQREKCAERGHHRAGHPLLKASCGPKDHLLFFFHSSCPYGKAFQPWQSPPRWDNPWSWGPPWALEVWLHLWTCSLDALPQLGHWNHLHTAASVFWGSSHPLLRGEPLPMWPPSRKGLAGKWSSWELGQINALNWEECPQRSLDTIAQAGRPCRVT